MAINMIAKNARRLEWLLHPIDRIRANLAVKHISSFMRAKNLTTALVADFTSNNRLAADAALLRSMGVIQITLKGKSSTKNVSNGYLTAQKTKRNFEEKDRVALVQLAARDEDLPVMRSFARINTEDAPASADRIKADRLLPGEDNTAYNMSLLPVASGYSANYYGPGRVVNASRPGESVPLEGELSVLRAVCPRPLPFFDGATFTEESFAQYHGKIPSIIIKDETKPSTPLGLASGGLMGAINFGLKRLYHLVYENARYLLASLSPDAREDYTVFMGKCSRYLKCFGQPMVGEKTLQETTTDEKRPQYLILTKPLSIEENQAGPKQIALVDKKSGQVKYVLPATLWAAHVDNLKKKMGTKFAHGMRGEEIARALQEIRAASDLTPEEKAQLKVFEDAATQADLWESTGKDGTNVPPTEWVFMEVIPGSFVAQKSWLDRLNRQLQQLSEKYRDTRAGKEMSRVLRENGNKYNLEDLVYLAMFTSDRGNFAAGFVGKFPALQGMIDPEFLGEVYDVIRGEKKREKADKTVVNAEGVFEGTKIFAINLGEATEVISFSDEKVGSAGIRKGEYSFSQVIAATVTYSRELAEEWQYWRLALGIPTSRKVLEDSYVGARRWYNPRTWINPFRRDQVIMHSTLSANLLPKGPAYIIGSNLEADERVKIGGPLYSIWSHSQLGPGVSRNNFGLLLYQHENVGPAVGEDVVSASGLYATYSAQQPLPGSGLMVSTEQVREEFPKPGDRRAIETAKAAIDKRNAVVNEAIGKLSPDAAAKREIGLLRENFRALRDNS